MNRDAVAFVRAFMDADKPVAAICHGPWLLVEADAVQRPVADVVAEPSDGHPECGRSWVDRAVETDQHLVTAESPTTCRHSMRTCCNCFAAAIDERRQDLWWSSRFRRVIRSAGAGQHGR